MRSPNSTFSPDVQSISLPRLCIDIHELVLEICIQFSAGEIMNGDVPFVSLTVVSRRSEAKGLVIGMNLQWMTPSFESLG